MNVDVIQQLGAVVRQVRSSERDGNPVKVVVASRTYSTTPDDLWNALTNPERLKRWFTPVSGDLRLGGRFQLEGNASGTITTCQRQKALAVTWEYGGDLSWVEVRLHAESGERTRLELEHSAVPRDHWKKFGPGAVGVGWDLALLGLEQFLTEGRTVDHAAWPASQEGKSFMRGSAEDWCRADIAGGAEAADSRAAAQRTAGFYTGESIQN
jgi:uncharacterized protein YndB with AHSA1/START domain